MACIWRLSVMTTPVKPISSRSRPGTVGTTKIGPMLDYKDQGTETAAENARTIASDLISCGTPVMAEG